MLAHRGASAYAPENTFAAFEVAVRMGAPGVETDVQSTSDGHLVLIHDETLDRTTNGHGKVSKHTLAEIQALDAGSWFGPQFAGERIPTLQEFLTRYGHQMVLRLEAKAMHINRRLTRLVRAAGLLEEVEFTSFRLKTVAGLCARVPSAKVGYNVEVIDDKTIGEAITAGARLISGRASNLTSEAVALVRASGLEPSAWGVGDDRLVEKVIDLGVDSFTTNWPDRALRLLSSTP